MSDPRPPPPLLALLRRDLVLAARRRAELVNPFLFFLIVTTLVPLAVGAESSILARLAPGIVWIGALLASQLALESLFRSDFEDGSLELLLMSPRPAVVLVLGKVLAHWTLTGLPLVLVSPLLALMLGMSIDGIGPLVLSLLVGTPILSLVGAIGTALTVGLRRAGALLSLLILPLYVPVLIFGAGAVKNANAGLPWSGQISFLLALLVLALTLAPLATTAALRISVD